MYTSTPHTWHTHHMKHTSNNADPLAQRHTIIQDSNLMMAADWLLARRASQLKLVITGVMTPASPVISKYLSLLRQAEQPASCTQIHISRGGQDSRNTVFPGSSLQNQCHCVKSWLLTSLLWLKVTTASFIMCLMMTLMTATLVSHYIRSSQISSSADATLTSF